MQASDFTLPFHHQPLYEHATLETLNGRMCSDALEHNGFSRGSPESYPYSAYDYLFNRGYTSRLVQYSSNLSVSNDSCATDGAISEILCPSSDNNITRPEGMSDYDLQQHWRWQGSSSSLHGVSGSSSQKPALRPNPSPIKSAIVPVKIPLASPPAAQVPTPASMAVLMNPNSRAEIHQTQIPPPRSSNSQLPLSPALTTMTGSSFALGEGQNEASESGSREKKHGCTMCHKRFDRPSTLKKHLLVHTGEKAFVCHTCGRRFGVASNLNRHVRRCILKPVNAGLGTKPESTKPSGADESTSPRHVSFAAVPNLPQCGAVAGRQSLGKDPNAPKRRRRAPSPSRWIPPSLQSFNLAPPEAQRATSVPLPPVRRNLPVEERDSWDENVSSSPYHPREWKNVLPGPGFRFDLGLRGKDVRNLNLKGNGGFMLGRLLVF